MKKHFLTHKLLYFAIFFALCTKIICCFPSFIEHIYIPYFFQPISKVARFLFGRLPFSLGDIVYCTAILYLLYSLGIFIKKLFFQKTNKINYIQLGKKLLTNVFLIYAIFNMIWGINYNRLGIAYQLNITPKNYVKADLENLLKTYIAKINSIADSVPNKEEFALKKIKPNLLLAYKNLQKKYSHLKYTLPSIKSSLYGNALNYMGFQGYYNPISSEAQINTTLPSFLIPNTALHEMAHQLGYAKEDEANYVGFLAAFQSTNNYIKYSCYSDIILYGLMEMHYLDSAAYVALKLTLHPTVKADFDALKKFRKKYTSRIENISFWFYNNYLKANNLKNGVGNYNEVLRLLMAN
jgi:hypothetical protein